MRTSLFALFLGIPSRCFFGLCIPMIWLGAGWCANALVVFGDDENPGPPEVSGANDAVSWVGELRDPGTPGALATPIGPRHFLTAAHLEFGVGDPFWFRGVRHTVVARRDLPDSDLAVGEVTPDLAFFVELYSRDDEMRRPALVLGKGRWKGEPLIVDGNLRGWRYAETGVAGIRWGTNVIDRVLMTDPDAEGLRGEYLSASFDGNAGADEVHLTRGDSGAPVFLRDCGVWKLAAVASAVDGPFVPVDALTSEPFLAALFDARGFVVEEDAGVRRPIEDAGRPAPTSWYAARVSTRVSELREIAGLPAVAKAPSPPDRWVWREEGESQIIPFPEARPSLDGGPSRTAGIPSEGEVMCVEETSAAGARVEWLGAEIRYTMTAGAAEPVDSFRYVTESGTGQARAWSRVMLVSRSLSQARPRVAFDRDGAVVVVWPAASAGDQGGVVPRVEWASDAAGPWQALETTVTRLEGWFLFAGRPRSERASSECFRLVFE